MQETSKENIEEIKLITMGRNDRASIEYKIDSREIHIYDNESKDEYRRETINEEMVIIANYMMKSIKKIKESIDESSENKVWKLTIKYKDGNVDEIGANKFPNLWKEFISGLHWLLITTNTIEYDKNFIKVLIYVVLSQQEPERQTLRICERYIYTNDLIEAIYLKYPEDHQVRVLYNPLDKINSFLYLKVLAETKNILDKFIKEFPEKDSLKNVNDINTIDGLVYDILSFAKEKRLVHTGEKKFEKTEKENNINKESETNNSFIENKEKNEEIMYSNNYNELKKMNFNKEILNLLSPLANPSIKGLRCVFIGNEGAGIEKSIDDIAKYLFKIGKICTGRPERLNLNTDFVVREDTLYYITDLQSFVEEFENNDDFSNAAEAQMKNNYRKIQRLISQIKEKYIIINCTELELKKFLKINSKLPYMFDTNICFKDLEDTDILQMVEESLSNYHKNLMNDDIRNEILNYIKRNRKHLPFKNKDLSTYISTYISRKEKIELPKERYNEKTLDDMFINLVGMNNVKQQLIELRNFLKLQNRIEKKGKFIPDFNLHMLFLGNPGTGKTTVARMVAKILFDLGYISENKLVEVEAKDLIAAYSGQTPLKTTKVINSAMGGVLFIDEAYSLVQTVGSTGDEAISTLVKAMDDNKGELVVILAGYSKEMQEFIRANSGIQSRIGYTFEFADYTEDELYQIFKLKSEKIGLNIDNDAEKRIREDINFGRNRRNFGNGRYIDNLLQKTLTKQASLKLKNDEIFDLTVDSIPTIEELVAQASGKRKPDEIEKIFKDIVGMDEIKKEIIALGKYIQFRDKLSKNVDVVLPDLRLHMLFKGEAGTGKTTMARKITEMLYNIGCIRINKLVEVERKDLVGEHIGETAPKTEKVIESALGGVLFIDEAYSLTPKDNSRDYGNEAIATLIKAMEDYKDEIVVIFAGYSNEMKDFVNSNSGIASRIGYTFEFENYKTEELYKIFRIKCNNYSLKISPKVKKKVMEVIQFFSSVENFGNGRFVEKLLQEILIKHSMNKKLEENIDKIMVEDIPTIEEMVEKTFNNRENIILPSDIDNESRRWTAVHEIGHAIVEYLHNGETTLKVITVVPEGDGALGYILHDRPKNKVHWTKRDYQNRIDVMLAGRAAEEIILGKCSSGCWDDLGRASKMADRMIKLNGMSDTLGVVSTRDIEIGLEMKQNLDKERKYVLDTCYNETKKMIEDNREIFDFVIDELMKRGTMDGEEFLALVKGKKIEKDN